MANYYEVNRTNYFHVTDERKWKEFIGLLKKAGKDVKDISWTDETGDRKHGFSIEDVLDSEGLTDANGEEIHIVDLIRSVLPEGEACIIQTIGREKMRYLVGDCQVITKQDLRSISMTDLAVEEARNLLQNPKWTTQMDY